ncbi:MAG: DUF4962 domain-containing protein [Verrucomicrobia bacterium]|nr:DUF4962 domain-containing protein [Verrucomicrobiota bacterium]
MHAKFEPFRWTCRHLRFVALSLLALLVTPLSGAVATNLNHPRLYFTTNDLTALRDGRHTGTRAMIWKNLAESADWCLTRTPREKWIAPISPDPRYENLYDRFYAIMGDLAITEHLSFAYALSGDARYGEAARQWVLASCRAWSHEADNKPDGGKAYAVSRLLKGVAVGYDIVYDRFTEVERNEIRETLGRIGHNYFTDYFSTATIAGPGFHTHHAIVEWASFGVTALALLDEVPEAQAWLDTTTRKFEEHLLPNGLAPDGAQTEGSTFWASTMQYRLFYMDALRRVTGKDLYPRFEKQMNADLALASIACLKLPGLDEHHANVVLEPSYGQLDYYAPVLLALAREYRRPIYQHLARWDKSLGSLQHTRYITPHGEELLFELGGYAYVWNDDSLRAKGDEQKLSWHFPSVDEAYARRSWRPGDLLAGIRKAEVVIHAGGQTVLIQPGTTTNAPIGDSIMSMTDNGRRALIRCGTNSISSLEVELDRHGNKIFLRRFGSAAFQFWSQGEPGRAANELRWANGTKLIVREGKLTEWLPEDHSMTLSVGNGLLPLKDPNPKAHSLTTVLPSVGGRVIIEIRQRR